MEWNYLSIPKLQRCSRWSLGMEVWEWISIFIPYITVDVIIYPSFPSLTCKTQLLSHVWMCMLMTFSSLLCLINWLCFWNLNMVGLKFYKPTVETRGPHSRSSIMFPDLLLALDKYNLNSESASKIYSYHHDFKELLTLCLAAWFLTTIRYSCTSSHPTGTTTIPIV